LDLGRGGLNVQFPLMAKREIMSECLNSSTNKVEQALKVSEEDAREAEEDSIKDQGPQKSVLFALLHF